MAENAIGKVVVDFILHTKPRRTQMVKNYYILLYFFKLLFPSDLCAHPNNAVASPASLFGRISIRAGLCVMISNLIIGNVEQGISNNEFTSSTVVGSSEVKTKKH
jgi:hypothetical protein